MNNDHHLQTLTTVCNLPTAPYAERHVIAYLLAWAKERKAHLKVRRDPAGNVYLHYRHGPTESTGKLPPLLIEAHMDHPGFRASGKNESGRLHAEFRGGVRLAHFKDAFASFWVEPPRPIAPKKPIRPVKTPRGQWVPARILDVKTTENGFKNYLEVTLETLPGADIPVGALGMWHLPDAAIQNDLFAARVCDDLAGLTAGLCMLDELIANQIPGHVIVMASRAEEVGFAGVLAAVQNRWAPPKARVIGLETSKASAGGATQGGGPIVRVGDKQGIFSPGLTHFLCQAAAGIGDDDPTFQFQRKLMDAGTCNSTAFTAFGYDAAGITLPLGNYHNMTVEGEAGWRCGCNAGPGIASETIHTHDFLRLVRLLVEVVKRYPTYQPKFGVMRDRLAKLYEAEQRQMLYDTSDRKSE